MLHGKGIGNYSDGDQSFLMKKWNKDRQKGMEDKSKLDANEISLYEISGSEGGGRTLNSTYEVKQFPFPTDPSIRKKQTVDIRKVDPKIGEMSD